MRRRKLFYSRTTFYSYARQLEREQKSNINTEELHKLKVFKAANITWKTVSYCEFEKRLSERCNRLKSVYRKIRRHN